MVSAIDRRMGIVTGGFVLDERSMTEVVESQWTAMIRLAVLLIGDRAAAEDVVQEACERVWRVRPAVDSRDHLIAYLRTAIVNRSRSAQRRQGTAQRHLSLLRPRHEPAADVEVLADESQRELLDALATLPDRQREVLVLRYWSRLSEAAIAETLGMAQGTVKSTSHRALQALSKLLKGHR